MHFVATHGGRSFPSLCRVVWRHTSCSTMQRLRCFLDRISRGKTEHLFFVLIACVVCFGDVRALLSVDIRHTADAGGNHQPAEAQRQASEHASFPVPARHRVGSYETGEAKNIACCDPKHLYETATGSPWRANNPHENLRNSAPTAANELDRMTESTRRMAKQHCAETSQCPSFLARRSIR